MGQLNKQEVAKLLEAAAHFMMVASIQTALGFPAEAETARLEGVKAAQFAHDMSAPGVLDRR